jgi:hypothetical protein
LDVNDSLIDETQNTARRGRVSRQGDTISRFLVRRQDVDELAETTPRSELDNSIELCEEGVVLTASNV